MSIHTESLWATGKATAPQLLFFFLDLFMVFRAQQGVKLTICSVQPVAMRQVSWQRVHASSVEWRISVRKRWRCSGLSRSSPGWIALAHTGSGCDKYTNIWWKVWHETLKWGQVTRETKRCTLISSLRTSWTQRSSTVDQAICWGRASFA